MVVEVFITFLNDFFYIDENKRRRIGLNKIFTSQQWLVPKHVILYEYDHALQRMSR